MRMFHIVLALTVFAALQAAPAVRCTSGALVSTLELKVEPPQGGEAIRLREVNAIPAGARLRYAPGRLLAGNPGKARVAMVIVPAETGRPVEVTEPRAAAQPAEWTVPARASVVGLVFGPQGLSLRKVRQVVGADVDLITQLAEYAEKSTQTENLLQALEAYDRQSGSAQNLEAALTGFAGAWRLPMSRLDRNMPVDQQAALLLRTLNPALATFDPLVPQSAGMFQQTAGLAASVAGLFWGNTVGLAAGSTALFMNLRTAMFPGTDLRSGFVQSGPDALVLCAQREARKPRTRLAYLWAVKAPNLDPPKLEFIRPVHAGNGLRREAPVRGGDLEARFLIRARGWKLVPAAGGEGLPVNVLPASASGRLSAVTLDLSGREIPPGEYRLQARWDWSEMMVEGPVYVHGVGPLEKAHPTPESQDRLVTGAGPVVLELTGEDFQFVEKASLRRDGDPLSRSAGLEVLRDEGAEYGPKRRLKVLVDSTGLAAGRYILRLEQAGGKASDIPVRILSPLPALDGPPVRVNLGEAEQIVTLRGSGLNRLEAASADEAELELLDGSASERKLRVKLRQPARKGERITLRFKVEGMHSELTAGGAMEVAGPRPCIVQLIASPAAVSAVEVREGELVAGVPRSFSVRATGLNGSARVRIGCEEGSRALAFLTLRSGEEHRHAAMRQTGPETLFVSVDPGAAGLPGCRLMLAVETDGEGSSDPVPLGTVVRLPRIENFELTEEQTAEGLYVAILEGYELDAIDRAGWNPRDGHPPLELPSPVPGQTQRQKLRIALPWPAPSPRAPLYVFLHGETSGRLTGARL